MDYFQHDSLQRALLLARATAPYLTVAKLRNLWRCEWEACRRQTLPRAYPYVAILDVAGGCHLHCLYCPTGLKLERGRRRRLLPLDLVRKLLAEVGDYLLTANLYNWGDPLLHPQLPEIVRLFRQRRVFTSISTNLNISRPDLLAALCDAGLDHLMISISGASQAVYESYHRNGRLAQVLDNLQFLTDLKRRRGLTRPLIELKYLVFNFNKHEVPAAAHLARTLGVDLFRRYPGGGPPEEEVHQYGPDYLPVLRLSHCHQLWHSVVVNADGGVAPCCYHYFKADDLGDFSRASLGEIRTNAGFVQARSLFNPTRLGSLPPDLQHPCLRCHLVHKQRHLTGYLAQNPHAVQGHRSGVFRDVATG